ncbi:MULTISPECIES: arabinosyltransferase domain-containing protein [Rhodococcus]|uniref:Arabinosyltransferase domain-containing protein n=1 Tax=Rhodococcus opacus TaxID=37919 RepID=A0AAX3YED8_RHOOP|nr:arabinosyltransferase domain-containing protein [Rhodococcus opacus]NHU42467.1 arabinosyltransferase [Rhodococcus sp. A14]MBA8957913.1 arabinosyltransferase C [Rhodococcus opacus]MBP2203478.1 arabinosyltransferase C [Rhodococcus opacus]MCZ4584070.1 arabinosyltransferase domain-containing protein [Rhodococcus opacus]MDV6245611.1 arabinosyltransferase domain-containing protein [Rhodococcus opacus]
MPSQPPPPDLRTIRTSRLVAIVTGLIGFVLALATPFLPVKQDAASIDWPQNGTLNSVEAPLVSYTPLDIQVNVPCSVFTQLGPDGGTVVSTLPNRAPDFEKNGLVVKGGAGGTVDVTIRGISLISADAADLRGCTALTVTSDHQRTSAEITGTAEPLAGSVEGDQRPQMVGLFTDLQGAAPADLNVHVHPDSRFSSSPTLLKLLAMIVCVLATLTSLYALHRVDGIDGRRARRFLPAHWWKFTGVDAVVIGTLLLWHVVGANTSDDGYLLGMARVSEHSGYMANYFRWFGVPEAPFGWSYELLAALAKVSTASMWMRLPTLLAALLCWMVISREVIPRLGVAVRRNRTALWTGGLVFLAFWLPYDNGLRPEPVIALGALLTWCSIERAIATGRLLPGAVAVLIAAFSLAAGPSGLICIAALIAGARPILQIVIARGHRVGFASQILPILAAGTVVMVAVFADQTLATVLESTRVRTALGPNVAWFDERLRWDSLMGISPDGSLARRFGVFVMLLCVVVCVMLILRKGKVPGTAIGPSRRILGIVFASLLLMMFTPTKWTHHFGVYAGLAGSVAVLAAVGVGAASIRSKRNRTLFAAGVLFILAVAFTSSNGWWYVSSYGVPWWDKPPMIAGKGFSTLFLGLTVLTLLLAAWYHVREPYENGRKPNGKRARMLAPSPLTVAAGAVVLFEVLSLLKGAVAQYPGYSIAKANIESVTGNSCALADEVLVETDPTAALLQPLTPVTDPNGAGAFGTTAAEGFTPNGIADDLTADSEKIATGGANTVDTETDETTTGTSSGTGGGTEATAGVNGSTVTLPFGLDPARTPVLGSYQQGGEQKPASLTTGWYGLPDRSDDAPILTISAAGRIRSVDADGVVTPGQSLKVEYGVTGPDGSVTALGTVDPIDIGPSPSWRNLRVPLDQLPAEANTVRLVADDPDTDPGQWLAVTPPRVPSMQTLQTVVGSSDPVLLDWAVGLAFPCQRPFDHRYGVAEVPQWRVLPDRIGAESTNAWQDKFGGGPLGWTDQLLSASTLATYLSNDWDRDWGSLERYTSLDESATPARVESEQVTRSGTWSPGPVRYY